MRRRCGVLGSPIAHSLSPTLHRAAYEALGLDWVYDAHDVDEVGLPAFLAGLGSEWRGLSLTMPLKSAVIGLCSSVSEQARMVGAANTVLAEPAGELVGLNTDVPGFVSAWQEAGITDVDTAVVLGSGATARSAVAALAEMGARRVTVLARSLVNANVVASLADRLGLAGAVRDWSDIGGLGNVDLLVSTLPASAVGSLEPVLDTLVDRVAAVTDVAYGPLATPLVWEARRLGLSVVEGLDLLLHQAVRQVELMTGLAPAPVERMRASGLAELARRERSS
ncbi:MAG: shikimate dehydrogenase [Nocardioidaceae bacterium]